MNIKNLFSKPEKFTDYEPESPAARAARKWDEREGEIIVQNYNLRRTLIPNSLDRGGFHNRKRREKSHAVQRDFYSTNDKSGR